jgi:outer membrane murein-binding lipoprotein Lpp
MDMGTASLVFALTVQGGALVWGASKISSSVSDLSRSVAKLDSTVEHLDKRVHDHETRVSVLERVQEIAARRGL